MSFIYQSIKTEVERLEKHRNVVCTTFTDQSEQKCCSWVKMQFRRAVNQKTVHKNIFTTSYPLQRFTYRVLQSIQLKLILLWVWAERAVLGRAKTALKFKYEI